MVAKHLLQLGLRKKEDKLMGYYLPQYEDHMLRRKRLLGLELEHGRMRQLRVSSRTLEM